MKGQTMLQSKVLGTTVGFSSAVAALTADVAVAADGDHGHGFGHHRNGDILEFLPIALLVVFAIAALVMWRRRQPSTTTPPVTPTSNAQAILAERLARGEITPDDYRAAVVVLRETPKSS
jgi:putative membrane protein